jgi:phenylalanyl-tRNA synthetase beta chain
VIRQGGGESLTKVQLFDIFRGKQVGKGKKSLAFSLTYIAPDRTLTDKDVGKLRKRIVDLLDRELGAVLRS